jgi:hypothetical protein
MHKPHRRPWGREPVPIWLPPANQEPLQLSDEFNNIRSELEAEGHSLPIHKTDPAEFDDGAR